MIAVFTRSSTRSTALLVCPVSSSSSVSQTTWTAVAAAAGSRTPAWPRRRSPPALSTCRPNDDHTITADPPAPAVENFRSLLTMASDVNTHADGIRGGRVFFASACLCVCLPHDILKTDATSCECWLRLVSSLFITVAASTAESVT